MEKEKKTIQELKEAVIYRNRCRFPPCACVLVRSDGSCGEPVFFNLLVSRSCVCVCKTTSVIVATVGVSPHLSVCACVIL